MLSHLELYHLLANTVIKPVTWLLDIIMMSQRQGTSYSKAGVSGDAYVPHIPWRSSWLCHDETNAPTFTVKLGRTQCLLIRDEYIHQWCTRLMELRDASPKQDERKNTEE